MVGSQVVTVLVRPVGDGLAQVLGFVLGLLLLCHNVRGSVLEVCKGVLLILLVQGDSYRSQVLGGLGKYARIISSEFQ